MAAMILEQRGRRRPCRTLERRRVRVRYSGSETVRVKPRIQDRLAAASELADRLHGRAVQAIDVDDGRPDVPCFIMPPGTEIAIQVTGRSS